MERLADQLRKLGVDARVDAEFDETAWREAFSRGRSERLGARLRSLIGFPLRQVIQKAIGGRRDEGAVLVPTTNPFFLPVLMVATRSLHQRPVVPLVYDLYPEAFEWDNTGGPLTKPLVAVTGALNRWWYKRADAVVFIGHGMAEHAIGRYGAPRRFEILPTGADPTELDPARHDGPPESDLERWCEGKVVLSYVGNMGISHDWDTLADAVSTLIGDPGVKTPFGVVVAGTCNGVGFLRDRWRELPADRVRIEGPLPDRAWARLLTRTHLSLVSVRAEANRTIFPSKALSAMAARSAIAAVATADSDLADVVTRYDCGMVWRPGDPQGMAADLARLIDAPEDLDALRERARRAAMEDFDLRHLATRWRALLHEASGD